MQTNKGSFIPRGKIIRDAIHGDIFIPEKFLEIIDTPEFQRLRRIKQLSVANSVFPSADHTRFSHSLGTFYIMELMIQHFEKKLQEIEFTITEREKDVALLAALLHDIGHGPFSHAFESIHPEKEKNLNHEEWTIRIITDDSSTIKQAIIKNFGSDAPEDTASLIRKQRNVRQEQRFDLEKIDLFSILSSLVSSQLDADRLDYLIRDSFYAGVTFGKVDISRIITSLQITVYDNKYFVCIPEKFLQDIEAYLLARYHMQKVVYYHDFKVQVEKLIKLIINRAYDLFKSKSLEFCPRIIEKLFEGKINVREYTYLDDSSLIYAFQEWAFSSDSILSELCSSFLYREKSNKINALDNSNPALIKFKQDVCDLLKQYGREVQDLKNEFFWIESGTGFSAYKINKENIWILQSNGLVVDLSKISKIINSNGQEEMIWKDDRKIVFINYNIIKKEFSSKSESVISELKQLIANYDIRKTIEIEKKYHLTDKNIFEHIYDYLEKQSMYEVKYGILKEQIDYYYDTKSYDLKKQNSTIRIRHKNGQYELTIKKPVMDLTQNDDQNERFEFKKSIEDNNIKNEISFINDYFDSGIDGNSLTQSLIIKNSRTPIILTKNRICFEMVLDHIYYENSSGKKVEDFQIEIELKSDYPHRVNLKVLSDDIEAKIKGLISSKTSKYLRGLELLGED